MALTVVYYVAASADGYIATPSGGVAWLDGFDPVDAGYPSFYESVDCLLMGRRTYQQTLEYGDWPHPGKPCWVFSRRALPAPPPEVTILRAEPADVLEEVAAQGLRRAWLVGGAELAGSFHAAGLIEEYIVTVVPLFLGSGIPLFRPGGGLERLDLVASEVYAGKMVQMHYRRAGD